MTNIRDSDSPVALLTTGGAHRDWVNQEIGFARGLAKLLIPVVETGVNWLARMASADDAHGLSFAGGAKYASGNGNLRGPADVVRAGTNPSITSRAMSRWLSHQLVNSRITSRRIRFLSRLARLTDPGGGK